MKLKGRRAQETNAWKISSQRDKKCPSVYSSVLETDLEGVGEGEGVRIKFTLSFHRALWYSYDGPSLAVNNRVCMVRTFILS